jgi:AraC-like DNA-binding protein
MHVRFLLPCPKLQPYVDHYLLMESSHEHDYLPVTVYPTPQAAMVFHYRGQTNEQVGLQPVQASNNWAVKGFSTKKTAYLPQSSIGVMMVGFKPWGIQPFIGFQAEEITDTKLDLRLVYPNQTSLVEEQLMQADSTLERVSIVENFLLSVFKETFPDPLVMGSIQSIYANKGMVKVNRLSEEFCLSEKQFVRRFRNLTGVSPKFFSRLVRFQHILKLLDSGQVDLLNLAVEAGFYDRSHFIHEFIEFTGTTPLAYLKENARTELGMYFDSHIEDSPFYHRVYQ